MRRVLALPRYALFGLLLLAALLASAHFGGFAQNAGERKHEPPVPADEVPELLHRATILPATEAAGSRRGG